MSTRTVATVPSLKLSVVLTMKENAPTPSGKGADVRVSVLPIVEHATREQVLCQLDKIVEDIESTIALQRPPTIAFQASLKQRAYFDSNSQRMCSKDERTRTSKYGHKGFCKHLPGISFLLIELVVKLAVLSYVYEALVTGNTLTKRDLYYRDVELFASQSVVDDVLCQLTEHLGVQRQDIGISAAAKGLVRGPVVIHLHDGTSVDCLCQEYLISHIENYRSMTIGACDAVLVVEKEAVFQTLCSMAFHNSIVSKVILVTGKGCAFFSCMMPLFNLSDPDLATRQFLQSLTQSLKHSESYLVRSTPFLCLVDHDPHGLEILATYKFGSSAMAAFNEHLAIPSLKWIGIHASDYDRHDAGVLNFTSADMSKLDSLLRKSWLEATNECGASWLQEFTTMKDRGIKAEIEIMSDKAGGLFSYLIDRITRSAWL